MIVYQSYKKKKDLITYKTLTEYYKQKYNTNHKENTEKDYYLIFFLY